jgi:hypothetical protein
MADVIHPALGGKINKRYKDNGDGTWSELVAIPSLEIETIAASDTDEPAGTTGAAGDYLDKIIIQPTSTTVGAVTVEDGNGTVRYSYPGGTVTAALYPFEVSLGITATTGFLITTGAGVTVYAIGNFS